MIALRAAPRRVGHRGGVLLLFGVLDELYALSLPTANVISTPASRWLAYVAPLDGWAAIWAAVGLVLIIGAFCERDHFAFATAAMLKVIWAGFYLTGWLLHDVYRGWVSAAIWGWAAALVLLVSTWPERQWPAA